MGAAGDVHREAGEVTQRLARGGGALQARDGVDVDVRRVVASGQGRSRRVRRRHGASQHGEALGCGCHARLAELQRSRRQRLQRSVERAGAHHGSRGQCELLAHLFRHGHVSTVGFVMLLPLLALVIERGDKCRLEGAGEELQTRGCRQSAHRSRPVATASTQLQR